MIISEPQGSEIDLTFALFPLPFALHSPFCQKISRSIQKYLAISTKMCYNKLDYIYISVNFITMFVFFCNTQKGSHK